MARLRIAFVQEQRFLIGTISLGTIPTLLWLVHLEAATYGDVDRRPDLLSLPSLDGGCGEDRVRAADHGVGATSSLNAAAFLLVLLIGDGFEPVYGLPVYGFRDGDVDHADVA
jgi:hypothetical protein